MPLTGVGITWRLCTHTQGLLGGGVERRRRHEAFFCLSLSIFLISFSLVHRGVWLNATLDTANEDFTTFLVPSATGKEKGGLAGGFDSACLQHPWLW